MELVADAEYHVLLRLRQVELAVYLAVQALPRLSANGHYGGVSLLHLVGHTALRNLYLVKLRLSLVQKPHHGVLVSLQLRLGIFYVVLVYLGQQWRGGHADVLQPRHHVNHIGNVDGTRAETARQEIVTVDAEEGHPKPPSCPTLGG